MFLALIVATLGIIIVVSAWKPRLHAGTFALAATLVLGTTMGGLSAEKTLAFFPQSLFLTLFGVTLFSSFLDRAGLLTFAVQATVAKLPRHRGRLATATFFIIAAVTALGLGNIAAVALVAPLAMPLARERGISFPAMSVVVIGGANAAAFSPLAVAGILVGTYVTKHDLASRAGLSLEALMLWLAGGVFVFMAFISFLGYRFFSARHSETRELPHATLQASTEPAPPLLHGELHAKKRLGLLVCVFIGALAFRVPLAVAGWSAAAAALVLTHVKLDDALKRVPFSSLLLVCGMSALVALAESRDLGALLAGFTSGHVNLKASPGVLSFLAGTLSAFSSSTGVVLPLFLPIVDAFSETTHVESGGFVAMLGALMAGTHVVDASPFSTLGALCIAACPPGAAREGTFRALLFWGLAMIPVAGLLGLAAGSFL
jgi:di/tricarboxylate transporter